MSKPIKQEPVSRDDADTKTPRVRGIGNIDSHSQDADRHRKTEHQKSEK